MRIAAAALPGLVGGLRRAEPVAPPHRDHGADAGAIAARGLRQGRGCRRADGFALGVAEGEHVGLFDVLVAPRARRRGLARRLTGGASAPGAGPRARGSIYLQVVATNEAALPLYAAQGFRSVYAYEYRIPLPL